MKLKDLQSIFHKELDSIYDATEVDSFFYLCIESFFNINRLQLALNSNLSITKPEQEPVFNVLEDLKQQKPIQYILGVTEFFGLQLNVNSKVLIPRPETEELVQWVLDCHSGHGMDHNQSVNEESEAIGILDIGTGSGCIAIALAKNIPNAKVFALDVSEEALEVAKKNAKLNNVDVHFFQNDILKVTESNFELENMQFDVIVSNPPYVKASERQLMKPNVLNNEPHLALFVEDNDALLFYNAISKFALDMLKPNGALFFEINEQLGQETKALMLVQGLNQIVLRKDLFGKDRMIKGVKV